MHDGKQLLASYESLWQKHTKRLSRCQQTASEEAVHKLRISCRRLLALIQLLQALAPLPALRKLRKHLKAQLNSFDELRDTQVMLQKVADSLDALPELAAYHRYLQLNEQRLLVQSPTILQSLNSAELQPLMDKAWKEMRDAFGKDTLTPRILSAIDTSYRTVLERYRSIDPADPATLHHLRISVKRLRYMLAASQELLPELPENHLERIQAYLTRLGEIQNSCVLLDSLNRFFGHQPPPAVDTYFQHCHQDLLDDYMHHGNEILQFWRPAAYAPFPWRQ
ncbi:CHAD domain-containing protein [Methylomonas methanica]|uniref:CHAD domain containing protein n=1 Tax=Methylomonas methanica (strain DSM 25384 / MC09) TaxID=857087 RepID=G0A790_METMM|nr:CHAD domain-containing protein [Methylomonas methanica]AEF99383.1 CHAD domain containing protein [Methylomonas methanica MC09]